MVLCLYSLIAAGIFGLISFVDGNFSFVYCCSCPCQCVCVCVRVLCVCVLSVCVCVCVYVCVCGKMNGYFITLIKTNTFCSNFRHFTLIFVTGWKQSKYSS